MMSSVMMEMPDRQIVVQTYVRHRFVVMASLPIMHRYQRQQERYSIMRPVTMEIPMMEMIAQQIVYDHE